MVYNGDEGTRRLLIGPGREVTDSDSGASVFMRIRNGNGTFEASPGALNAGTGIIGNYSVTNPTAYDGRTYTITFTSPTAYEVRDPGNVLVTSGTFTSGQSIAFAGTEVTLTGAPATNDTFVVAPSVDQDVFETVQSFVTTLQTGVSNELGRAQFHNALNASIVDIDQAMARVGETRSSVGSRLAAIESQQQVNANLDLELNTLISDLKDLDYAEALSRLEQQLTSLEAAQKSYSRLQGMSLFNYI